MNNQTFKINWKLIEDYPTRDGEYIVCYPMGDGTFGDPSFMDFHRNSWDFPTTLDSGDFPAYWAELPLPTK